MMIAINAVVYIILFCIIIKLSRKVPSDGILLIQYDDEGNQMIKLSIDRPDEREDGEELMIEVKKEKVDGFNKEDFE